METLSTREKQIAQLLATGLAKKQVADQLNISTRTVEGHSKNIYRKIQAHNIADLTRYVIAKSGINVKKAIASFVNVNPHQLKLFCVKTRTLTGYYQSPRDGDTRARGSGPCY
jgi:DNA-binding CsgD family transcriptional regulator